MALDFIAFAKLSFVCPSLLAPVAKEEVCACVGVSVCVFCEAEGRTFPYRREVQGSKESGGTVSSGIVLYSYSMMYCVLPQYLEIEKHEYIHHLVLYKYSYDEKHFVQDRRLFFALSFLT